MGSSYAAPFNPATTKLSAFAQTSSAELASVLSNEAGLGALVFGRKVRRRVALIGNSETYIQTANNIGNNLWWAHAFAILGWPFELAGVSAAAGRTTQDALTAFPTEVATLANLDEIWVFIGRNDLTSAATATAALLVMDSLITLALNTGAIVRIATPMPALTNSTGNKDAMCIWNRGLMERARGNVHVIDIGAALRDTSNANGNALSSLLADATYHPNALGAYRMGKAWAASMAGQYAPLDDFPIGAFDFALGSGNNTNSNRFLNNPLLTGSGGTNSNTTTVTGNIPASWTLGSTSASGTKITATTTQTVDTATNGRQIPVYQIVVGGTITGAETLALSQFPNGGGGDLTARVTAGTTRLRARVNIQASGVSATFYAATLDIQMFGAGYGAPTSDALCLNESGAAQTECAPSFTLETPAFVPVAGTVYYGFKLGLKFATGICTGTFKISEPVFEIAT